MSKDPKQYPISAEQYLIANYEQALVDNRKLTLENKLLANKLSFYEHTKKDVDTEDAANKIKVLPILGVTHSYDFEYSYYDYKLTPEKYDELVEFFNKLKQNPEFSLTSNKFCKIIKTELNASITILGFTKYVKVYIPYQEINVEIRMYDKIVTFEEVSKNLINDIESAINSWDKTYKQKYLDAFAKKESEEQTK